MKKSFANDRVVSLPGLGKVDSTQFAGYSSVRGKTGNNGADKSDEKLFYWFVGDSDYAKRPTILWTNGGPGSSSFWGFLLENGPYIISSDGKTLSNRAWAWNNFSNYMIFEHPLSVTLSFAKHAADVPATVEVGVAQLYQALLNFVELHPEIADNPIILAGESYAGTYLPLLAKAVLDGNKSGQRNLDLKLMVLCDAWVNPMVQMATDTTYAIAHGLISQQQKQILDERYQGAGYLPKINAAIAQLSGCYMANIAKLADPPFDPVFSYLNRTDVRKALHIDNDTKLTKNWSALVSNNYAPAVNDSYAHVVQYILDNSRVRVRAVSGLNDAKDCNFIGTQAWLSLLQGDAAAHFASATPWQWKSKKPGNAVLGFAQGSAQLGWLKVLNAGHMAAMDQPELIHYILDAMP
jgi:vitellogenic carboxypeptidase-like protein